MRPTAAADQAVATLRGAGLKATGPRVAILRALADDRSHPTAERIHARLRDDLPSLSLSTVYSTLEAFIGAGLCRRVRSEGPHLRVDPIVNEHDHAVCAVCKGIFDVDRTAFLLPPPPSTLPGGLEVTAVHLEYEVICGGCRAEPADSDPGGETAPGPERSTLSNRKGGRHGRAQRNEDPRELEGGVCR